MLRSCQGASHSRATPPEYMKSCYAIVRAMLGTLLCHTTHAASLRGGILKGAIPVLLYSAASHHCRA
eukprot:4002556-Alexandrium_andersonii.AAC.1